MSMRNILAGTAMAAATVAASAAPIAYEGVLVPGVADTGSVGGFSWFLESGSQVDFWRFSGVAGQTVTLDVNRLNGNLDPGLSLYSGITSADTSLFSASGNWGGLTFLGSLDDEHAPFLTPGPGGDPFGSFVLPTTGNYTVAIGGSTSTDAGSYPYRVTLTTAVAAVPEPETWAMLSLGLAAVACLRRRRQT
jgi:Bacterial pre-peptidase C-terminal domain/PEP-CTERM motif